MADYDFYSPFFSGWIVGSDEKKYRLWTTQDTAADPTLIEPVKLTGLTATGGEQDIQLSSLAYLSSVTVSLGVEMVPEIEIVLTPPFDEARKIIDSKLVEYAISFIEVQFGYVTGKNGRVTSPTFRGVMQPPDVSFGADVTITMKGIGTAAYYLSATGNAGTSKKQSRAAHIKDFAEQVKAKFDINDCLLTEESKKALQEEIQVISSGKSNMHLIFAIASQVGCWVQLVDAEGNLDKVVLVDKKAVFKSGSVAVLALFDFESGMVGTSVGARGVFPILSVSVQEQAGLFLGPWSKKLRAPNVDAKSLEDKTDLESKPGKETPVTGPPGKDQVGVANESDALSGVVVQSPEADFNNKQKALDDLINRLSNNNSIGLQIEIETIGVPDAIPATIYEVKGVSARVDGFYTLFKVVHNLSGSGFTSTLTLIQNSRLMTVALQTTGSPRQPTADEKNPTPPSNIDTPATETVSVAANPQ